MNFTLRLNRRPRVPASLIKRSLSLVLGRSLLLILLDPFLDVTTVPGTTCIRLAVPEDPDGEVEQLFLSNIAELEREQVSVLPWQ